MSILLSPPVVFAVALGIALVLYWMGRAMAPKTNMTAGKAAPYASGEDAPMAKAQFGFRLFYSLAIFFTVLHVAALVVTTLPTGPLAALGFVYLAIIMLAVFALVSE